MSRYVFEGIASDLEGGAHIGVLVARYNTPANVLHQITQYTDEAFTQVRISDQAIYHESGGSVNAFTDPLQVRGTEFDVWVIPHGSASDFPFRLDPRVEIIEY